MDYGLVLPSLGDGASREGIDAALELAATHGFTDVWGTDHLLVDASAADDYGRIFEILTTLAWVAGRSETVKVGASVVVAPMRNAVVLAKELATIDVLSNGRLIAGFGVGWNATEFANVGASDRFAVRGAYTEETVALCRHLWSGSTEPFRGRFHELEDFVFGPLPPRREIPIWLGGRDERALRRAGRLADAYHSSGAGPGSFAKRLAVVRAAAEEAGRPLPRLSARVRLELDAPPQATFYTMHGSAERIAAEIRAFAELGVDHLALAFPPREPKDLRRAVGRFVEDVRPLV
ncbi:MAG TPA: TIGR03619 family F420-dependent LLM class oxidoreductase [Candidatus Deferrimicrobiaceae bacterium]|nr:TIGR03619 family F420-dependent LLM class oxidoreductase [Candidatus Deferrimicrobiaceae bacterium]